MLDEGIGNLTTALKANGMLERTLLLFSTDNGAPYGHFEKRAMSNYPLKGGKGQLWEVRARAPLSARTLEWKRAPRDR